MLELTGHIHERVRIADNLEIAVLAVSKDKVRLAVYSTNDSSINPVQAPARRSCLQAQPATATGAGCLASITIQIVRPNNRSCICADDLLNTGVFLGRKTYGNDQGD